MYRYKSEPTSSSGVSLTTGTTAWTYTSYGTITSGVASAIEITGLTYMTNLAGSAALYDTTHEAILELAQGTGTSLVAQIPFSWKIDTGVNHILTNRQFEFSEPISIQANQPIYTRIAQSLTTAVTYSGIKLFYRYELPTEIVYDSSGTGSTPNTDPFTSPFTYTHNIAGEDSRLLIVSVASESGGGNVFDATGVTFSSGSMTKIIRSDSTYDGYVSLWYLYNPPVGLGTVSVSFTPTSGTYSDNERLVSISSSFYNVNSGTPVGTFSKNIKNDYEVGTAVPNTSVTTTMGGAYVINSGFQKFGSTTVTPFSGQIQIHQGVIANESSCFNSYEKTTTKGVVSSGWIVTGSCAWTYVSAVINPQNQITPVANRVQSVAVNGGGYVNVLSASFTSSVTEGNTIIGAVAFDPANAPTYLGDNLGNTYTTIQDGAGGRLVYAPVTTGGSCTITGSFPSYQDVIFIFNEYSTIGSSGLDVSSENTESGYGTSHTTGTTGTTTQSTALAVSMYRSSGTLEGVVQIDGYTELIVLNGDDLYTGLALADKSIFSTGVYSGTFTTGTDYHQGQVAIGIFKLGTWSGSTPSGVYRSFNFMLMGVA